MSNLPKDIPVENVDEDESGEWRDVEPKFPKHRIRRCWEWIEDLFGWRPSADIYDEINAPYDDRSPDPTTGDGDGQAEPV